MQPILNQSPSPESYTVPSSQSDRVHQSRTRASVIIIVSNVSLQRIKSHALMSRPQASHASFPFAGLNPCADLLSHYATALMIRACK